MNFCLEMSSLYAMTGSQPAPCLSIMVTGNSVKKSSDSEEAYLIKARATAAVSFLCLSHDPMFAVGQCQTRITQYRRRKKALELKQRSQSDRVCKRAAREQKQAENERKRQEIYALNAIAKMQLQRSSVLANSFCPQVL